MKPITRRRASRQKTNLPAKLQQESTGRYVPAQAVDFSNYGALLEVDYPVHLQPGHRVRVAVCGTARQVLLAATAMQPGTIVRSRICGNRCRVEVEFDPPQALAVAA